MNDRELRRLSRQELLELLLEVSKENEMLKAELETANKQLMSKRINLEKAGNIADAALNINRVFEAAQNAASQYLANIRLIEIQKQEELDRLKKLGIYSDDKE